MEIKNVTFSSSIFMPFREQYPSFDDNFLFYNVDEWKIFSFTFILYVGFEKRESIIKGLDETKESIFDMFGTRNKAELDKDTIGSLNTIDNEIIRLSDRGFIEDRVAADYEVLSHEAFVIAIEGKEIKDKPDFSLTHLEYN